ncbi:hypothetical protein NJB18091_50480 [Mycobacterium marinum]|uniref:DUF4349 domain-containing protein n=1 Tax=Mycobacterium marinum TaxID=1781 RepID=UPI0021C36902|nr:DUF4349 domain-containing protein [Mycobacterium marinum]GJO08170.1 hypothetical protein NJB18091_50480 [Mycobacterium marinum]
MTVRITPTTEADTTGPVAADGQPGPGALSTDRGSLPLERVDVGVDITGLTSRVELRQDFVNAFDVALEASYVFPLPDRAAVTRMRVSVDGRDVEAELREREAARRAYDEAIASGRSARMLEEDRPDVFTIRVGNIVPGQRVTVALTIINPLTYEDGEATFRFPLVVAPRYIPGEPLADIAVGDGYADDTDAVPDASRITPPMLVAGFAHSVPVTIDVGIDPAAFNLSQVRSNMPAVTGADGRIQVTPGAPANRDFVLRLDCDAQELASSLVLVPDAEGDEGTYQLTVLPPAGAATPRPRHLVLVLDRSRSMAGWKMTAARRAASRIVDALTSDDRFAVLTFDDGIEYPVGLPAGLTEASDRHRYRAVEHLARVEARGDTEMLAPLRRALALLGREQVADTDDAVLILISDGQVGNEDQLLQELSGDLGRVRLHTIGVDEAVNAGFLRRLAGVGGGRCVLVDNEDRLDEALPGVIQRCARTPLATGLEVRAAGFTAIEDTMSPARLPDLLPGVPLVVSGRYRGSAPGSLTVRGATEAGADWSITVAAERCAVPAVTAQWARAHLRDLEDGYAAAPADTRDDVATRIVDTSLRFGVLCRFTAYVASELRDGRVVAEGALHHRVIQPVAVPAPHDPPRVRGASQNAVSTRRAEGSARGDSEAKRSKARTVKLRNVVAVALVSALLVGTGWIWSLSGDGLSTATRDQSTGIVGGKPPEIADSIGIPETKGSLGGTENTVALPEAPPPPRAPADGTYKRDIITNGSLQMVVAAPAQAADQLAAAVSDAGGRVDSRSERSGASSPTVSLVVRIPADKLDGVLADAKNLGEVESMSIGHTDVTSQRVDLDARIEALQTSVNRLRELMGRAGSVADLLAAESSLTERQAELDSLRAQRTTLGDEISYATINVTLSSKPTVAPGGFLGALERGWQSLIATVDGLVLTIGFLLPWIPVLGVLVLAVVWVLRRKIFSRASGVGHGTDADLETES